MMKFSRSQKKALRWLALFELTAAIAIAPAPVALPNGEVVHRLTSVERERRAQDKIDAILAFAPFVFGFVGEGGTIGYQIARSQRLRSAASAYYSFTPQNTSLTRDKWKFGIRVKRGTLGALQMILGNAGDGLYFTAADQLAFSSSSTNRVISNAVFRDTAAWYDIELIYDAANATAGLRIRILVNGVDISSWATDVRSGVTTAQSPINTNSLHYIGRNSGGSYFDGVIADAKFIDGDATAGFMSALDATTNTYQPIKYTGTYGQNGWTLPFSDNSAATAAAIGKDASGMMNLLVQSQAIGTTGWTNTNVTVSLNNSTAPDGTATASLLTPTATDSATAQSAAVTNGAAYVSSVWLKSATGSNVSLALIQDTANNGSSVISNITVTPVWQKFTLPFTATGTASTFLIGGGASLSTGENIYAWGAELKLATASTEYQYTAANAVPNKNWTPNNISVTAGVTNDSFVDVPTLYGNDNGLGGEVRGNYATLNPLSKGSNVTLTNGNLSYSATASTTTGDGAASTLGMSSGKWYCEWTAADVQNLPGISSNPAGLIGYLGQDANSWGYYGQNGHKFGSGPDVAYGATYGSGDIIGIAFDADAGNLTFYKNGVSQGTAFSGLPSNTYFFAVANGYQMAGSFNFGQRPFAYTAPSGYKALCTQNLPTPAIIKPSQYFDIATFVGTGADQTIPFGFDLTQGAMLWGKKRSATGDHLLVDSVRYTGTPFNTPLYPDLTNAEQLNGDFVTSSSSAGILKGGGHSENLSGVSYAHWAWKKSVTSGFDIVPYTGDGTTSKTITHGLGVTPAFIVVKNRTTGSTNWLCWHKTFSASEYIALNLTSIKNYAGSITTTFGGASATAPTSTSFTVGSDNSLNQNGNSFIAYVFAEVPGFSKISSFVGNGSADGTFVYCGFRPRFVLLKRTDAGPSNWFIWDSVRDTVNPVQNLVYPNLSNAEATAVSMDFTANGFKMRTTNTDMNASSGTYIFMAIAAAPLKYARAA